MATTNEVVIKVRVDARGVGRDAGTAASAIENVTNAAKQAVVAGSKAKQTFTDVAGAFVSLLVAQKAAQAMRAVAQAADEIQMGMASIKAVTSLTGEAADSLKRKMLDTAETVGASFTSIAQTTRSLIAQSLSSKDVELLLEPLAKFQRVGDVSEKQATSLVVALGTMGVATVDTSAALDMMLKLANATALESKDFVDVLTRAGPVARTAGQSFGEMARTAALLKRGFQSGAVEGTNFTTAIVSLMDPARQKMLRETFNVNVVDSFTGKLKPLTQVMFELSQQVPKVDQGLGLLLKKFGVRAGARVFATGIQAFQEGLALSNGEIIRGTELLKTLQTESADSAGTVNKSFEEATNTLTDKTSQLKVAFVGLVGEAGGPLIGALTVLVSGLAAFTKNVREVFTITPLFGYLASATLAVAAAFITFKIAQIAVAASGRLVAVASNFAATSLGTMTTSIATSNGTMVVATGTAGRLALALNGVATAGSRAATAAGGIGGGAVGRVAGGVSRTAAALPLIGSAAIIGATVGQMLGEAVFKTKLNKSATAFLTTAHTLEKTSSSFQQSIIELKFSASLLAETADKFEKTMLETQPTLIVGDVLNSIKQAGDLLSARGMGGQLAAVDASALFRRFAELAQNNIDITPKERIEFQGLLGQVQAQIASIAGRPGETQALKLSKDLIDVAKTIGVGLGAANVTSTRFRTAAEARGATGELSAIPQGDVVGIPLAEELLRNLKNEIFRSNALDPALSISERAATSAGLAAANIAQRNKPANQVQSLSAQVLNVNGLNIQGGIRLNVDGTDLMSSLDDAEGRAESRSLGMK